MAKDGARSILAGPGCDSASVQFKSEEAIVPIFTGIGLLSSIYAFVNNTTANLWLQVYDTKAEPQSTDALLFSVPLPESEVGNLWSWEPSPEAFHGLRTNPNIRVGRMNPICDDANIQIFGGYPFAFGCWILVSEAALQISPTADVTFFPWGTARYRNGESIRRTW